MQNGQVLPAYWHCTKTGQSTQISSWQIGKRMDSSILSFFVLYSVMLSINMQFQYYALKNMHCRASGIYLAQLGV